MPATESKLLPLLSLAFTMLAWGIAPVYVRAFAVATGPADSIVIRMWFTAFCALPCLFWTGWRVERKDWPMFAFVSIFGMFGYFIGSIFGFSMVPASVGGMVFATQPLMIAALAAAVGVERLTPAVVLGMAISFAGSIYLFSGDTSGDAKSLILGGVLIMIACFTWAFYVIFSKPLIQKYGAPKFTLWTLILCAPPSLLFMSPGTLAVAQGLGLAEWIALLFLSVIGTLIAVITWSYAIKHLHPSTLGMSLYLVPAIVPLAAWAIEGEVTGVKTLVAGAIILAGVAVAEFGKSLRVKPA